MTPSLGIEPGPHWWEASALTTAPSLHPYENGKLKKPSSTVVKKKKKEVTKKLAVDQIMLLLFMSSYFLTTTVDVVKT